MMSKERFADLVKRETFLNPGETGCGLQREVFGTLLGSCVAITLWHPQRHFGSICHFILPSMSVNGPADGRSAASAFQIMQNDLVRHAIPLRECVAKIFGGGRMFSSSDELPNIGENNIRTARHLIKGAGMQVAAENVGGEGYRRLYFDVFSGEVWLKFDWIDDDQEDTVL